MKRLLGILIALIIVLCLFGFVYADGIKGSYFIDVPNDSEYAECISWAVDKGLVYGTGANKFNPDSSLTMAQLCAILSRYLGYSERTFSSWGEEIAYSSNICVREGILLPEYLENLSSNVEYATSSYFIFKGRNLEYPRCFFSYDNVNIIRYLCVLNILDASTTDYYKDITRGEFIDLLYKIDSYDFDSIPIKTEYTHKEILEEFGDSLIFEDDWAEIDCLDDLVEKEVYLNIISSIPEAVRKAFLEDGWKLYIGNETLNNYADLYTFSLGGITDYQNKVIAVMDTRCIYHEFGHYIQHLNRQMGSFENYYNEGKESIKIYKTLHLDTDREYFAIVFELYMYSKYPVNIYIKKVADTFAKEAPKTWEFFEILESSDWRLFKSDNDIYEELKQI